MPKANPYHRPSLKNLALGLLMLFVKDIASADTRIEPTPLIRTTTQLIQSRFTYCQRPVNDTTPLLTTIGLLSLNQFREETAIGNALQILTEHPEIYDTCDQYGESPLFYIATYGSDEDFSRALTLSNSKQTHMKNFVGKTLMDILIEKGNFNKIKRLVQTIHDQSPQPTNSMNLTPDKNLIRFFDEHATINKIRKISYNDDYDQIVESVYIVSMMIGIVFLLSLFCRPTRTNNNHLENNPNVLFNQVALPVQPNEIDRTQPRPR